MTTLFSTQPKAQTTIDNTAELQAAFNNGGDYVLSGDIVLDADITVNDDRTTNLSISGGPQKNILSTATAMPGCIYTVTGTARVQSAI